LISQNPAIASDFWSPDHCNIEENLDLRFTQELSATGHPSIMATHPTTFEITKDSTLTKRGDCIIAVNATKGLCEFSPRFLSLCKNNESKIIIEFEAGGIR
jgi:hypothetical protein